MALFIEYEKCEELIVAVINIDNELTEKIRKVIGSTELSDDGFLNDAKILHPVLVNILEENNISNQFGIKPGDPSISYIAYFYLWTHTMIEQNIAFQCSYLRIFEAIRNCKIFESYSHIRKIYSFTALHYHVHRDRTPWSVLTKEFDGTNWIDIEILSELLVFANVSADDFIVWMEIVVANNKNDYELYRLRTKVYDWLKRNEIARLQIHYKIKHLSTNERLKIFLTTFLTALTEFRNGTPAYYRELISDSVTVQNAYFILLSLGKISLTVGDTDEFKQLLIEQFRSSTVLFADFIRICDDLNLYPEELFAEIENTIAACEDISILTAIIHLLQFDRESKIPKEWKQEIEKYLFTKQKNELVGSLDFYLLQILENDIFEAYNILEFRFAHIGHLNMLKRALVQIIDKDKQLFQKYILKWLVQEGFQIHFAIREICSISEIKKEVFRLPFDLFAELTQKDKIFVCMKIIGFVYSLQPLQNLALSVIKSVDDPTIRTENTFHQILCEFLIFNYRSTLTILKKEIQIKENITSFAYELFKRAINEYEEYFDKLREIKVDRELRVNKHHLQLKSFHMKQQSARISSKPLQSSFLSFAKTTQINSEKWAVRDKSNPKHKVDALKEIIVSTEFPSGEYLDPVSQERLKRIFQRITKDEINTD